ncbi:MAG: methyltransferase domain-containing protein [Candidatus Saccharimonadales bacterium]
MKSLVILGRQPALGIAELESLYGPKVLRVVSNDAVAIDLAAEAIDFKRLGGSVKLAKILNVLDYTEWSKIEKYLSEMIPDHLQYVPEGKFKLGLSAFGLKVRADVINATGLRLKKVIKASGRSVRIVPNKSTVLNSAQVLHNQLASATGWELVLVRDGGRTILALTVNEQDIDAYARRDQIRPRRDAKVGMLPPKLAQVLINLAAGPINGLRDGGRTRILDPFCGTGVLLQEAMLMGYQVYGTDIEPRMIEYSRENLQWLEHTHSTKQNLVTLEQADAASHTWQKPIGAVACETFLGKPLNSLPSGHVLEQIRAGCDSIHEKFLRHIAPQLEKGTRLCLAVPAWRLSPKPSALHPQFLHLKTLDLLTDMGYTRISFSHAQSNSLVYHRPDQVVARELVVLTRI